MDVVGSEIGQKMRSAIKAKLTELGCYVDDELPDYVMVMVANKRTRAQMEDDLQLFLGDNTEMFVNWLHQVLKKLQEVTVTAPVIEKEKSKEPETSASKERKPKEKKVKDKSKKSDLKKAKKKEKVKSQKKKTEKKPHKKKKSKHHEMIRPNIPPLLMNMEKESEPSITDVFAGQILKNHGVLLDTIEETKDKKTDVKRPILPIIDPSTILSTTEEVSVSTDNLSAPQEEQLNEINEIEAKIQGLKQKLVEQLDSMSDDDDFITIRTEAEELMNDFAEDVFQEISQQTTSTAVETQPLAKPKSPTPPPEPVLKDPKPPEPPRETPKDPIETLPQIELNLPKRPVRERLGLQEPIKAVKEKELLRAPASPERYTPEREPEKSTSKPAKSRLGDVVEAQRKHSMDEGNDKVDTISKRLTSKVSVLESRGSRGSVVRVRPRPRVNAPASSLLLRAVADAHKSLLNTPPKIDPPEQKIQRALVLPMRRTVDAQKIVIQVPTDSNTDDVDANDAISLDPDSEDDKTFKMDGKKEEYIPLPLSKKIQNTDYRPSRRHEYRTSSFKDDSIVIETINIHNPTVDKDKNTQFIVTMDGYHPNAFLAKKLQTEGLLEDETDNLKDSENKETNIPTPVKPAEKALSEPKEKRLSDSSAESDTQVIIKKEVNEKVTEEKRQEVAEKRKVDPQITKLEETPVKKRKSSPIVFDIGKKEREKEQEKVNERERQRTESVISKKEREKEQDKGSERERQRTESVSSDNHVIVTTTTSSHKYDSLPPLSVVPATTERAPAWCRAFPACRYGAACAFQHPRCKFLASCTRRGCPYSHTLPVKELAPEPVLASHVVPAANYKSISTTLPAMCKYYPSCVNPACHFYHPKPCRYGKNCINKLDCNFYHSEVPTKWYPI